MKEYVNFYENLTEAKRRLLNTVVLYDSEPYMIHAISDHKADGIFRVYLEAMKTQGVSALNNHNAWTTYFPPFDLPSDYDDMGPCIDKWMQSNPNAPLIRKKMNSPLFKKFRPFPLGMVNAGGDAYYVERRPLRKGEQGLLPEHLDVTKIDLSPEKVNSRYAIPFRSDAFRNCVIGEYPSAIECIAALTDPDVTNTGAAFDRLFAIIRGPLGTLYLAYKSDIVGMLPNLNLSKIVLDRRYAHVLEAVQDLHLFSDISVK